jgi:hypothetical protein
VDELAVAESAGIRFGYHIRVVESALGKEEWRCEIWVDRPFTRYSDRQWFTSHPVNCYGI